MSRISWQALDLLNMLKRFFTRIKNDPKEAFFNLMWLMRGFIVFLLSMCLTLLVARLLIKIISLF